MTLGRRPLMLAAAALPVFARLARADTIDLALACEAPLAPALARAAAAYRRRTGVRVRIFPTSAALLLPQLRHDAQNDILAARTSLLEDGADLIGNGPRTATWRNPLVLAGRSGATLAGIGPGAVAVPDPLPGADIDAAAVLAALALKPTRVMGAANTAEVAFLLTSGAAVAGLLHLTEVRADPALAVLAPVPGEAYPPILSAAVVTKLSGRPNPAGFIAFLGTEEAVALLADAGLESAS
jgi:molybdate transport system substrate-binding protein